MKEVNPGWFPLCEELIHFKRIPLPVLPVATFVDNQRKTIM